MKEFYTYIRVIMIIGCLSIINTYADNLFGGADSSSSSGSSQGPASSFGADMANGGGMAGQFVPPIAPNAITGSSSNMLNGQTKSYSGSYQQGYSGQTNALNPGSNMSMANMMPFRPRPPMKPDDFQKSVQIRSGIMLKQYGYKLFNLPNTFTPVSNLPIDSNYTLGPGDEVFIQAWGAIEINYTAKVSSDGTIFIPKVGNFNVVGIKAGSLEGYLKNQIGKVYKKFQISATVSKIRSIQINVTGFAEMPGTYTVSSLTSLVNAIFAAGGPSNGGSLRHILLKRNGTTIYDFDMYDVLLKGNNSKDVRLLPGDVIYFAPKGNEVAIYDGVKIPAIYETKTNETIGDVLSFAGGPNLDNAKTKVILEHISNNKITVNSYPYLSGLKETVDNGAIIHFMLMTKEYSNTIVLMGNVAHPTRLPYRTGMRVSDVIPNRNALLTASFWNSYNYNTYAYDHVLSMSGLEKTTNRFKDNSASYTSSSGMSGGGNDSTSTSEDDDDKSANTETNDDFARENSNLQNDNMLQNSQANMYANENGVAGAGNVASKFGGSLNKNDINFQEVANRKKNNNLFETSASNLFQAGPISIPEADINWNYAAIIRIDPKDYTTHVIPFNLELAINKNKENDIQLQSGDVIDILSTKDIRNPIEDYPNFVYIDGEVKNPGVYELRTSDTLVDLINKAGGVSSKAYLFGLELDRTSVRKKQVKILNQMLDQAQQNLISQSGAAALSATTKDQADIQQVILKQQQALIDKMRKVKPMGRVVLRIKSNNATLADLPRFEMLNGDTVYIPPRPDTVDVIGQVYNPATFAYDKDLNIGDYIEQAGSENTYADTSTEYVLQANGIIYNKAQLGWYDFFALRKLNPGDTVVVPQNMQFGSVMQNLLNWTQILSNFGMGAAAIAIFKD